MNIILWIVFGGIAGWITSLILKTDSSQGIFANILLGIAGALLGGFLFDLFGGTGITGFNIYSLIVAVIGSIIIVWLIQVLRR